MYINCVYCGHRYGSDDQVSATMAQALKEHVERCDKHPMSAMRRQRDEARAALQTAYDWLVGGVEYDAAQEAHWEARARQALGRSRPGRPRK